MPDKVQGGQIRIRHDRAAIQTLLDKVLEDVGPVRFSGMRLLQLEKLVRTYQSNLPGKTVLREVINSYRAAKWPHTQPSRTSHSS